MADGLGRRTLLRCGAACALAAGCGKFVDEPVAIEAGTPNKNLLSVPMARMPELGQPGGSVLLHANAVDFLGRRVSVLVANTSSEGLRAYGAYCPHSGCEMAWVDGENSVVCPCHLSRFAVDGTVTHPPAVVDLDTYPAKLSPDGLTLVVLRSSATQMLAFDARCPHLGCAVSGASSLFICPCHGSLFDLSGAVKLGPAERPLTALQVTFDGTNVVVKVPA